MSARSFVDTNVLVYTDDDEAPEKKRRALELVGGLRREQSGVVSTQVLQEYFAVTTRKLGVDAAAVRRKVELFARLDVVQVDVGTLLGAIDLHRLHGWSIWDSLIVRAALDAECVVLFSENLNATQGVDGLEVVNPFG